jgi:sulfide:quinone oxidoreductase
MAAGAAAKDVFCVVIGGGGVAAAELALALRALAGKRAALEIVAPNTELVYRPLAVAEPFGVGRAHRFPLSHLARETSAGLHEDAVASVDPGTHAVTLSSGRSLSYDVLVIAVGARARVGVPGATTFDSEATGPFREVLENLRGGERIVFALPDGITWPLPLYELALITSAWARPRGLDVGLEIVTPEREPLEVFGPRVSKIVRELLDERRIRLTCKRTPVSFARGELVLRGGRRPADYVVAAPILTGPELPGLPHDRFGFLPVDRAGAVAGIEGVFAAGDCTSYPLKQGGLAVQQAGATARAVAALCGAETASEREPVELEGLLLTGAQPLYLHRNAERESALDDSDASFEPRWWPPAKISGGYFSVYAARAAAAVRPEAGLTWLRVETDDLAPYLEPSAEG